MRLLHSRNSWHYRQGSDPTVDFCLWVLQVDGLHVPPFDQHPEGDGSLRALGLTALDWETWFLRVLDPQSAHAMWRTSGSCTWQPISPAPGNLTQNTSSDAIRQSGSTSQRIPHCPLLPRFPPIWRPGAEAPVSGRD